MIISSNAFLFINLFIVLIFVITCIISVKNGLLLQAISLVYTFVALFVAWLLSPIVASRFTLIKIETINNVNEFSKVANTFVYFIIIFIIMKIIYFIIKPLLKKVSKIPLIGSVNKIGGFIFGLLNATIILIVITLLFNASSIKNKQEVRNNTLLKYGDPITKEATKFIVNNINLDSLKEKIDGFNADEARKNLAIWLIEKGILDE